MPHALRSLWRVGTKNVVLQGALMRFQSVHDLVTTGNTDGTTWRVLTHAVLARQNDPMGYDYVYVDKDSPEHLTLYVNGHVTQTNLVNTGVADAPTENGTYPVYLRFVVTSMAGTLPDGAAYDDPGIPWVSYFHGGDALHGFIRSTYGWAQSLGCVEMSFANAATLWPHTPIGTLVTVA
jgi:lipoprotein-anchoring transpeptidase ErfK/SrfK